MGSDREVEQLDEVVLFDGVCIFCNTSVDFILQHEKEATLFFTPLQSDIGKEILRKYGYPTDYSESILFLKRGKVHSKSNAALAIAKYLKPPFSWMRFFLIIPRPLRDFVYEFIAKRRYRWFGKFDACMIPNTELRARFLE